MATEFWHGMKVRLLSTGSPHAPREVPKQFAAASSSEEREFIEQLRGTHQPQQATAARVDKAHEIIGLVALALMACGAWRAWGLGYSFLLVGTLLLAGIIWARVGADTGAPPGG